MAFFGFFKKEKQVYHLLMDKDANYLGKGEVQNSAEGVNIQFKVLEGKTDEIVKAEIVQVVPMDKEASIVMGRVILRRGNNIVIEPMRDAGAGIRKNFRMPVDFESFIYFDSGGRAIIRSIDLSCGGIAFYSVSPLDPGEEIDVVIPITVEGPLIVRAKVLRSKPFSPPIQQYACQFIDLIHDEEAAIQEAVFTVQLERIRAESGKMSRRR